MKYFFTLGFLFFALPGLAFNNYLSIRSPDNPGFVGAGNIRDVSMEVTPKGLYAEVDLIFTIADPSTYSSNMEGIVCFDLPAGSFIHDSWLWLDDSTIISADIIERNLAIQIYDGIVRRRQDPSLLIKNLTNHYRLNVYPIRNNYARKVKIKYSVPFVWHNNKASFALPTALLGTSAIVPSFKLKVNTNATLDAPSFGNGSFAQYLTSQSTFSYNLNVPATAYRNGTYGVSDIQLVYHNRADSAAQVFTYPTSANEGVYQLVLPASVSTLDTTPKTVLYIIDRVGALIPQYYNIQMAYPIFDVLRLVKSAIVRDLKPTDSFNVVYSNGSSILKGSPTWRGADSVGIESLFAGLTISNSSQTPGLRNLLRVALPLVQSKPHAQAVLVGCDNLYSAANPADTMFQNLDTFLGGFKNRVDVINNSTDGNASAYFYNKLCAATGGNYYSGGGHYYDTYTRNPSYDIDYDGFLRQIHARGTTAVTAYNVVLPLSGIAYSNYQVTMLKTYNPALPFTQVGRYYGSWSATGNVELKYVTAAGIQTHTSPVMGTAPGSPHTYKSWLFNYMNDLKSLNGSGNYKSVLIDSSIKNRVLHDYTAFLALETGDTIKKNVVNGGNGPTIESIPVEAPDQRGITLAPNPFTEVITIRCSEEIVQLQIRDITGKLIWEVKSPLSKEVVWRGTDALGAAMNPGIYIVSIIDKTGNRHTAKVEKR